MAVPKLTAKLIQEAEIKLKSDGLNIAVLQETILQKELKLLSKIEKKEIVIKKKKFLNFSRAENFKGYKKEIISDLAAKGICPGCLHQKGSESFYIHEIIRLYKDEEFQKKYEDEKIMLCRNHFLLLLNEADGVEIFDYFINLQLHKITILQKQLAGFVAKHDYRLRKEMTGIEEKSWANVFEYFGSKKYITSSK